MTIFQSLFPATNVESVIVILKRHSEIVWLLPILATAGSVLAASIVFWIGRKIGKNGLEHWVSPGILDRVKHDIREKGAVALVLPALLPPPCPLFPFVLACGALSVSATRFFTLFAGLRLVRFSVLTALAWFYGGQLLVLFQTETFKIVMGVFVALIVVGTSVTIYRFTCSMRKLSRAPSMSYPDDRRV